MNTPKTSVYDLAVADIEQEELSQQLEEMSIPALTLNDPPCPGYIYAISYADTSQVLTYRKQGVVLAEYEGKPTQRWVCHSKDGWLGFTHDPGETTSFLGYIKLEDPRLICKVNYHKGNEMFCVRKRTEHGFQVLMRSGEGLNALWPLGKNQDGQMAVVRGSDDWWGFTKTY